MAGVNVDSLNGFYKEVYGELVNAVPEAGMFQEMVPFRTSDKIGDSFHEPSILSAEQGYAYGGSDGSGFDLESPVAMVSKDIVVPAFSYCMHSQISYTAITRAMAAGKQAFGNAASALMENALESATKRLEVSLIHGQVGIGDVPDTAATVETTSTTATLVFSEQSWAPGIWCGAEGAQLQFYDLDNDALISSGSDAVFSVTRVTNSTRTVVVTGTATGIDALDVAVQAGGVRAYYKGSKTNDMPGIASIFANSGSQFGIDAAVYGLWRGNSFDAAGQLTMNKVLAYVADLVGRGLRGDIKLMVSPLTWANLEQEQAALRVFDSSYKSNRSEAGVSEIVYHGQNGLIEVTSNPIVKNGQGFLFEPKNLRRIGSAELLKNPLNTEPFYPVENKAVVGFRLFSDQAIYARRPARTAIITGITN